MGNCGACHESGAPVRSETRISKIFFGSSKRKVILRQTTGNQTKTNSFVRDVRFLRRSRFGVVAHSRFFLWICQYFINSLSKFPNFWSKFSKSLSVKPSAVQRTIWTFTKKSETAPAAEYFAFSCVDTARFRNGFAEDIDQNCVRSDPDLRRLYEICLKISECPRSS